MRSAMNKILVIGSAVADVIITLPHLPDRCEDVHVRTQHMTLGGCGMNTFDTIRHLHADAIPFFPIGTGAYGDFVRAQMAQRHIFSPVPDPGEDNGCCYCFIEDEFGGERTFLSYHGAEYRFRREWFDLIDSQEIGYVYICGLEIEEKTGINIVDYLEHLKELKPDVTIFFSPGPRITRIEVNMILRIMKLSPVLHLNRQEAQEAIRICTGEKQDPSEDISIGQFTEENLSSVRSVAEGLSRITGSPVIITLGANGSCCYTQKSFEYVPAVKTRQVDANGAGDAHIGAVIASLQAGKSYREALEIANRVSSLVVSLPGGTVPDDLFPEGLLEAGR